MSAPWSPLPNLSIATVAISQADVATAAAAPATGEPLSAPGLAVLAATADAWLQLDAWLGDTYQRAPALVLVLAALLVLPPLAVAGVMLRRRRSGPDPVLDGVLDASAAKASPTIMTVRVPREGAARPALRSVTVRPDVSGWPTEAWIEQDGRRHVVGRAMLRIGREADNDLCLTEKTVHRYHAVIRRTTDGDVIITDLSGPEGNGVLVNGALVGESRLKPGDVIAIGEVKLNFDARPI